MRMHADELIGKARRHWPQVSLLQRVDDRMTTVARCPSELASASGLLHRRVRQFVLVEMQCQLIHRSVRGDDIRPQIDVCREVSCRSQSCELSPCCSRKLSLSPRPVRLGKPNSRRSSRRAKEEAAFTSSTERLHLLAGR